MTRKALTYFRWGFVLLFMNFNIGYPDLLPDFLGVMLILWALKSQEMTETEHRLCPLLLLLVIDYFLHWFLDFDNVLENLIIEVISTYTMYVLLGEMSKRVQNTQPDLAESLHHIRIAMTVLSVAGYLMSPYETAMLLAILAFVMVIVLIYLLWLLFKIKPMDS